MASVNLVNNALVGQSGTGSFVGDTSPTLVTPLLGTPTSGVLTNCTALPVSTGISGLGSNVATFLATPSSSNLASAVTDETGTGSLVFAASPTLITPTLGVAAATSINFGDEALDTYDEGLFTPTVDFATTGDLSVVYGTQTGNFTKIGDIVVIGINIGFTPTYTTATGTFTIEAIPFSSSGGLYSGAIALASSAFVWDSGRTAVAFRSLTNTLQVTQLGSAGGSPPMDTTNIASGSTFTLIGSVTFKV